MLCEQLFLLMIVYYYSTHSKNTNFLMQLYFNSAKKDHISYGLYNNNVKYRSMHIISYNAAEFIYLFFYLLLLSVEMTWAPHWLEALETWLARDSFCSLCRLQNTTNEQVVENGCGGNSNLQHILCLSRIKLFTVL